MWPKTDDKWLNVQGQHAKTYIISQEKSEKFSSKIHIFTIKGSNLDHLILLWYI